MTARWIICWRNKVAGTHGVSCRPVTERSAQARLDDLLEAQLLLKRGEPLSKFDLQTIDYWIEPVTNSGIFRTSAAMGMERKA